MILLLLALCLAQQPHTGGPHSKEAVLLTVDFEYVPEGLVFKEMVLHIQDALLSGGVPTNIFRPKGKVGQTRAL